MKRMVLILFVILISILSCTGQKIEMDEYITGYKFYQNDKYLTMNDLVSIMESNKEAYQLINSARSNKILSQLLGGVGGFLVGWQLGTAIAGGEPNWTTAVIGGGIVFLSVPFSAKSNQKAKNAVDIYNAELSSVLKYKFKPQFRLTIIGNGIGLSMRF